MLPADFDIGMNIVAFTCFALFLFVCFWKKVMLFSYAHKASFLQKQTKTFETLDVI